MRSSNWQAVRGSTRPWVPRLSERKMAEHLSLSDMSGGQDASRWRVTQLWAAVGRGLGRAGTPRCFWPWALILLREWLSCRPQVAAVQGIGCG